MTKQSSGNRCYSSTSSYCNIRLNYFFIYSYFIYLLLNSNFLSTFALYTENINLSPFLVKYEKLNYDTKHLNERHSRVRRSIDNHLFLNFKSHGRDFKVRLSPVDKHNYLNEKIEINSEHTTIDLKNALNFYNGYLIDEPHSSHVSGSIIDGVFYGTITSTKLGKFFIESSRKYNHTLDSHSIIYNEKDVNLNRTRLDKFKRSIEIEKLKFKNSVLNKNDTRSDDVNGCASDKKDVKDWMKREQEELYKERIKQEGYDPYSYDEQVYDEYKKYSREANENYSSKKSKRQSDESRIRWPGDRTICNLYLRVDPHLHTEIFNNEGNKDPDKTTTFLLFYLNKHVEALNTIYNSLPFYDQSKEKYLIGLQFMIYRTKIITQEHCKNGTVLTPEELKLCEPYLDVSTFLNYVSLDNFTDYCLSYTFTARDFTDGTLGLAWVAKLAGSVGGVCEKRQTLQGVAKSLNSGIVTVVNYQARVPEAVSQITFAHEVGHNFGSEHDPDDSTCSPGSSRGGNYIMYRRATTGTDKNNRNFSQCSRDQMGPIVHNLILGPKFCFKQYSGSLCGNGIVEEGEECDCGYGTDCKESCCIDASQEINKCKLKPGKACSPSQGPCCDNSCNFASQNTICMSSNECLNNVFCSGKNATCPRTDPVFFKPDKTECNSGTQVCKAGVCSGSICEKYEMQQCFIEGDLKDKRQDKSVLCHLACIGDKTENKCTDSFEIPEMKNQNNSYGLILKPGSPCVGTLGYCDIFSKCRAVDAEGPLARLKNILLNPKTLSSIRTWVTTYWWAASLIVVGFLVFMVAFIKVCSVHTPSSNPRKPPALKITDTLRRPMKRIPHPHWPNHHQNRNKSSEAPDSKASRQQVVNEKSSKYQAKRNDGGNVKKVTVVKAGKKTKEPLHSSKSNQSPAKPDNKKRNRSNEPIHYYSQNHPLHPIPKSSHEKKSADKRSKSVENSSNQRNHRSEVKDPKKLNDKKSKPKSLSPSKHHKSEFISQKPSGNSNGDKKYKIRKRSSTETSSIDA